MNALAVGAALAALSVLLGAFGAHALRDRLGDRAGVYDTGARYHQAHALAFVALGVWQRLAPSAPPAPFGAGLWLLLVGVVLFSGSLYVLAVRRVGVLGPVTPLGGVALVAGWVCVLIAAIGR